MVAVLQHVFDNFLENYQTHDLTEEDKSDLIPSVAQLVLTGSNKSNDLNEVFKKYMSKYYIRLLTDKDVCKNSNRVLRGLKFCNKNEIKLDNIELNKEINRIEIFQNLKDALLKGKIEVISGIQNCGLDPQDSHDKQLLIEIAKICAAQDGWITSEYIKNFGLDPKNPEDREALIEIAKICAAQDGGGTSEHIKNYGLDPKDPEDREVLIEIAKICAAEDGGGTSEYIKNYGLDPKNPEDREALIEIAKICAAQNGGGTSEHIKNYGLDPKDPVDREVLIEIAKICAAQDGGGTSEHIKNYGLDPKDPEDREVLIEIAKICAAQDAGGTSEHIINYGLDLKKTENQIALTEIFKIALDQNFFDSFYFLKNYNLDFTSAALSSFLEEILNKTFVEFVNCQELKELKDFLHSSPLESYSQQRYDFLVAYFDSDLRAMENFINQEIIIKESLRQLLNFEGMDERNKIKAIALIAYTVFKFKEINEAAFKTSLPVIKDILQIRQPRLRYDLINRLHSVLSDLGKRQSFFDMYDQAKSTFKLPLLYCALFEMDSAKIVTVNRSLNLSLFKKDGNLKRLALETLDSLSQLADLALSDKSWLMEEAFKGNLREVKSIMQLIKTLILVGRGNGLTQESLEGLKEEDFQESLKKQVANQLKSLIPVSSEDEGLYEKYRKVTEQFRDPTMLLQYMQGTVKRFPGCEHKPLETTFGQFVEALLNGNFQVWRYSQESNPHLKTLFQEKALEEAWKTGLVDEIGAAGDSTAPQLDFKNFIRRSFGDHHFDKSQFPELVKYLEKPDSGTSDELKVIVNKEAQKKLSTEKIKQEMKRLSFTLKAIELMETTDPLRQKNILENLINLKIAENQFADDLKDWKAMLGKSQLLKVGEILKVVEGDDPYDLLVCGTEVLGSCQSVYGQPSFNKCLLGYIANGQNRLIAVKDFDGRIVARALIRLLSREGKPVLFLERLYPANITENQKGAIYAMAEKKARVMGLPLFQVSKNKGGAQIQSLGGQAPYDYVDASDGVASAGKYAINNYTAVWEPMQEIAPPSCL